jgi:hypothetical protein
MTWVHQFQTSPGNVTRPHHCGLQIEKLEKRCIRKMKSLGMPVISALERLR